MCNLAAMPIYEKNSSSLKSTDQESWCVALCTSKIIQILTCVDSDAKVKFGHLGFCMGKSESYMYLSTAALGLKLD